MKVVKLIREDEQTKVEHICLVCNQCQRQIQLYPFDPKAEFSASDFLVVHYHTGFGNSQFRGMECITFHLCPVCLRQLVGALSMPANCEDLTERVNLN